MCSKRLSRAGVAAANALVALQPHLFLHHTVVIVVVIASHCFPLLPPIFQYYSRRWKPTTTVPGRW